MKPKRTAAKKSKAKAAGPRRPVRREYSAGFVLVRRESPKSGPNGLRFLLLDYGKHWDYAKGHLEEGETAWQAAVRELAEETGIREVRRVGDFEKQIHYFFTSPRKGPISKTVTFFIGETQEEKVALSHEHEDSEWLSYLAARDRLTYDTAKEILDAAWMYLQSHTE